MRMYGPIKGTSKGDKRRRESFSCRQYNVSSGGWPTCTTFLPQPNNLGALFFAYFAKCGKASPLIPPPIGSAACNASTPNPTTFPQSTHSTSPNPALPLRSISPSGVNSNHKPRKPSSAAVCVDFRLYFAFSSVFSTVLLILFNLQAQKHPPTPLLYSSRLASISS